MVIVICLHVWCDAGTQFPNTWSQTWSSAHRLLEQIPSTTDNCLKFMLQIGQLFGVLFLSKKHICQEFAQAYLLI